MNRRNRLMPVQADPPPAVGEEGGEDDPGPSSEDEGDDQDEEASKDVTQSRRGKAGKASSSRAQQKATKAKASANTITERLDPDAIVEELWRHSLSGLACKVYKGLSKKFTMWPSSIMDKRQKLAEQIAALDDEFRTAVMRDVLSHPSTVETARQVMEEKLIAEEEPAEPQKHPKKVSKTKAK